MIIYQKSWYKRRNSTHAALLVLRAHPSQIESEQKNQKKPQKKNVWGETPSNAGITGNFVEGTKKKK
jgi:hypothetical protein